MTPSEPDIFDEIAPPMKLVACEPRYLNSRDVPRAMRQFARVGNVLQALDVTMLYIPPVPECPEQSYVASVAVAISPYIILANFKAPGRNAEVEPARQFFESMGYECLQPPFPFEGEADLKKVSEGVYLGGYGQSTDPRAFDWITEKTGVDIVPLHIVSDDRRHLDELLLIVSEETALVATEGLDPNSLKVLDHVLEIVEMTADIANAGCANAILVPDKRICVSGVFNLEAAEWMNSTFDGLGYTCVFLSMGFNKISADLSSCVMRLDFEPQEEGTNDGTMRPPNTTDAPARPEAVEPGASQ